MKPPLGEDMHQMSGRRTGTEWGGHASRMGERLGWDGIGRRRSGAQVLLILRCQTQILAHLFLGYLVCNEYNFGQSWGQWPKVSSLLQVFSREIRAYMMVRDAVNGG